MPIFSYNRLHYLRLEGNCIPNEIIGNFNYESVSIGYCTMEYIVANYLFIQYYFNLC